MYLTTVGPQHPELLPQGLAQGYTFQDRYHSRNQGGVLCRITLKGTQAVFTRRPSFVRPSCVARRDEVEKALSVRQWGVPFAALAYVFGRNALFWDRAGRSLGRPNLGGTTVKRPESMPQELVADEKITWLAGEEVVVPPTVGGDCVRGLSVAEHGTSPGLQEAYEEFKADATAALPDYQPRSVCTDGFTPTPDAWRRLFPQLTLVRCFLPSILKLKERCRGALRPQVLERAWPV